MRIQILLLLAIAGLIIAPPASAAPAACAAGTYASYVGTSCTINGLLFDDFTFQDSANPAGFPPGGIAIPSSSISVTPITTPGDEGFQFNLGTSVSTSSGSYFQDEILLFRVSTVDGSASIQDLTLFFNGSYTGTGTTNVTENYCLDATSLTGCSSADAGQIKVNNPPPSFNDKALLNSGGVSSVYVSKDIDVMSGTNGTATISIVSNTFTHGGGSVPEPWSMLLVGSGLVGVGLMRKFRKS